MLTITGHASRYCDGVTRRQALQIGGLAMGGLALPQLLQTEARSGSRSQTSIIMIFLTGGPPLSGRPRYLVDHSLYQPLKELI